MYLVAGPHESYSPLEKKSDESHNLGQKLCSMLESYQNKPQHGKTKLFQGTLLQRLAKIKIDINFLALHKSRN